MLSRHLSRIELVSLARSLMLADHALLPNPAEGLTTIADLAAGPLGANQTGFVVYSSYERGDDYIRLVTGDRRETLTAQQWWGGEATIIGDQPATRSLVTLDGAPRGVITYAWIASNGTVVSVVGNIDDTTLRKVANSAQAIKGSTRSKLTADVFAASDPFGRPAPSPSVIDASGATQTIVSSGRTRVGDWYYGTQGDQECLTVWRSGQRSSGCDRLVNRPGQLPSLSVSLDGTRFFIVHAPPLTFSIVIQSSKGRNVDTDNIAVTNDQSSVYLGRLDESSGEASASFTVRMTSIVGQVTASTFALTTPTAPALSTTR